MNDTMCPKCSKLVKVDDIINGKCRGCWEQEQKEAVEICYDYEYMMEVLDD